LTLNASQTRPAEPEAKLSQKEQYLQNKKDAAEARKKQNRIERLSKEAETLEADIDRIDAEMNECATDYLRLAALDTEKTQCEERLLAIYEELEELGG